MANQRNLKAFVRLDGSGRVVASSLILRKNKPKVGRWHEIIANECCNPTTSTTTSTTTAAPVDNFEIVYTTSNIGPTSVQFDVRTNGISLPNTTYEVKLLASTNPGVTLANAQVTATFSNYGVGGIMPLTGLTGLTDYYLNVIISLNGVEVSHGLETQITTLDPSFIISGTPLGFAVTPSDLCNQTGTYKSFNASSNPGGTLCGLADGTYVSVGAYLPGQGFTQGSTFYVRNNNVPGSPIRTGTVAPYAFYITGTCENC